jgi:hypothetical protein
MKPLATTPLPDDIAALFANTRQATPQELAALEKAADALQSDPDFLADCSKALAREEILRAEEEAGPDRKTLAAKS